MAEDAHKKEDHGGGSVGMKEAGERIIAVMAVLFVISLVIFHWGGGGGIGGVWENIKDGVSAFMHETAFGRFLGVLLFGAKFLGTYISLILFVGIVILLRKSAHLHHEDVRRHQPLEEDTLPQEKKVSEKWQKVKDHLASENQSDWRLAILEADIILDEMLEKKGYLGQTLGEKLRSSNKGDLVTLDKAWEAHLVRNRIAHEGASFLLSEREAKRVIGLFEETLNELSSM